MGFGKPLLDREIVSDLFFGIKCPSDDGICAVCPNEETDGKGMDFAIFQAGNKEAVLFPFQFRADGIGADIHAFGNNGFQPKVKFMSVQIDIKPLIMADEPVFQVYGLYGKDLRVYQYILWQGQIKGAYVQVQIYSILLQFPF